MAVIRMKSSSHLGILFLLQLFIKGHMSTSCGTFGNKLNSTNPLDMVSSNYYLQENTYFGIGAPLACAGNATRWNVCYFPTASSTSASATLQVYRCSSGNSNEYEQVQGSTITVTSPSYTSTPPSYVCTNISLTSPFTVNTGDVLVGCIHQNNGLNIAAIISGSSVYYRNRNIDCSSNININNYQVQSGLSLLISLDVDECAVNNGGCGQICNDTTSGYNCSCYPGYHLQPDGLTCTMITTSVQSVVSSSSINIAPTPSSINIASTSSSINIASTSSSINIAPTTSSINIASTSSSINIASTTSSINIASTSSSINIASTTSSINIASTSSFMIAMVQGTTFSTVQGSTTPSYMANSQEGSAPATAILASFIIIVIIAVVMTTVTAISIVLWRRRYKRKLKISAIKNHTQAIDNVMYSTSTTSSATILTSTCNTAAVLVYEPLKDDEFNNSKAQATYETPQASGMQNINNKQPTNYEVPIKSGDNLYTTIDEQMLHDSKIEDENPYYMPASHEEELYVQLENQRIKKIPRKNISATKMLGSGQFGGVQIGIWNGSKGKCEVAIKTLNPTITQPDEKVKFLQEAAIMAQFRHPNVIQLYGIVTDGEPVMLVIELAHRKDLRTHLVSLKPDPGQLAHQDLYLTLLTYSKQIAAGMKYLSNKSFVHRDLAARNILVTQDCICKIADFGMSRDLADDTYYVSHGGMVPIKWTAPEAIHFKKYSTASDVWSYGCLLYEIWSMGMKPFEGKGNAEVVLKVDSGYRLPPPPGCPLLVYQLMIQCWNPEPHSRSSFRDIYLSLYQSTEFVLKVPDEVHLTHPQAGVLGATLEAGEKMYIELQKTYV